MLIMRLKQEYVGLKIALILKKQQARKLCGILEYEIHCAKYNTEVQN